MDDVLTWLSQPQALRAAERELRRLRLPLSLADDALQDARLRIWRARLRNTAAPVNPSAYAYRVIQNAVRDLQRPGRAPYYDDKLDEAASAPQAPAPTVPVDLEDECRRIAYAVIADSPRPAAAALHLLTFLLHRDVPIPRAAPTPETVDDQHAAEWAALWLAGQVDCFPRDGEVEDQAIRQRRSRAIRAARSHLRRLVVLAGGEG